MTQTNPEGLEAGDVLFYPFAHPVPCLVALRRNHDGVLAVQSLRDPDCGYGDSADRFQFVARPGVWQDWSGGENPVPGMVVEVQRRTGMPLTRSSDYLHWDHTYGDRDIIAWRIPSATVNAWAGRGMSKSAISDKQPKP